MEFKEKLLQGTLVKRYKRFFADIKISNKQYVVFQKKEIPKGIYFIEITTKKKKYFQKIIIN